MYLFPTFALGGVGCQRYAPVVLPLGKSHIPIVAEAGWTRRRSEWVWGTDNLFSPPGLEPWSVQAVAIRYTNCANSLPTHLPFILRLGFLWCLFFVLLSTYFFCLYTRKYSHVHARMCVCTSM